MYFLRHGETIYSRTGGYCGSLDPDLTSAGQKMAVAFEQVYRSITWEGLYVSPMQRTIQTATPLALTLNLTMERADGLKELDYGLWEGKTNAQVKVDYSEDYIRWLTEPAWNPPTGGETAVQVANRAMEVIRLIQAHHGAGNVLIVSHKATIRIMLCSLLGIDLGRYRDRINILAASVSMVEFKDHGPLLQMLNDRGHFSPELLALEGT